MIKYKLIKFEDGAINASTIKIKVPEFSMLELYKESKELRRIEHVARCYENWIHAHTKQDIQLINNWKFTSKDTISNEDIELNEKLRYLKILHHNMSNMENQHKKITGYRDLSQEEIDLINEIKATGIQLGCLTQKLNNANGVNKRWLIEGTMQLQQGIMSLVRAVAKPESF